MTADQMALFGPGLIAAGAIAILCAVLSVFVVLKRLAFIGQGVSHAAFGGVGLASLLALGPGGSFALIALFCVLAAQGVAWASDRRHTSADTVIGVVLVGSMALGAILLSLRLRLGSTAPAPAWEEVLFGSILAVGPMDAWLAWLIAGVTLLAIFATRRMLLFWTFDEPAAEAFGVRTNWVKAMLMMMLAIAIVVSMKLAGVVLATALLILPGAIALRISARLGFVFAIAIASSLLGMAGGLIAAFQWDLPPGACVVGALLVLFALTWPARRMLPRL